VTFQLDTRLGGDTFDATDWALCRVLLMNDARFPWVVLVPRRPGLVEWHDLDALDRGQLAAEIARASAGLKMIASAAKINVGALGNIVPQLHVHIVARTSDDAAWPGPVWGSGPSVPYEPTARDTLLARLRAEL
jgi:diadenosine tetraphosphate (Ap4A) HIT family hydrolase